MKLLIVESPNKEKTLSGMLGGEFKVAATAGHIRDLPQRELGIDLGTFEPTYEFKPGLPGKPHTGAELRMKRLRAIASEADMVYIATDPDREGEAIAWHVREVLRLREGQYCRVTFGSIEGPAVMKALAEPRDIDMGRVQAQEGRRVLDRLVGYMVSPVLSDAGGMPLSAGRVQSVALRLIVDRERAITAFKVTNHYGAVVRFDGGKWAARWDTSPFVSEDQPYVLDQALAKRAAECRAFTVTSSETKEAKEKPAAPFSTATLMQAASVSLHFSTDRTMKAAQGLFEGSGEHGYITYHRTDSVNFSETSLDEIRAYLVQSDLPVADKPRKFKEDDAAQEGHPAIRPTDLSVEEAGSTPDERALYRLIRERALASQMAEARYNATALTLKADDARPGDEFTFAAKGRVLTFAGWRTLMNRDERDADAEEGEDDDGGTVPALAVGTEKEAGDGRLLSLKTAPPKRYTEASLVGVLKHEGVGRPSTYNNIVATLLKREYVHLVKRQFRPSDIGMMIVDTLVKAGFAFMEVAFTRDMESSLDAIAKGAGSYRHLASTTHSQLQSELAHVAMSKAIAPLFKCPKCEGALRRRASANKPAFWVCSSAECKHFMDDVEGKPVERKSFPCPRCETAMRRFNKRKGTGQVWVCPAENCETFLDDVGGRPVALHECKKCSAPLIRFQRKNKETGKPTQNFGWVCSGETCREFYDDEAGKPVVVKKADCPTCGKPMYRRKGDSGFWWGCSGYAAGCKTSMDDDNGKPVPRKPRKATGGPGAARGGKGRAKPGPARPKPGEMPSRLVLRGKPGGQKDRS